ncbi:MAG: CsbD family protein [Burkholderiales bacterium]
MKWNTAEGKWQIIESNWKQFKGNVKAQWSKLTDDQIDRIAGKRDLLSGKIQIAYGFTKEEAEVQIRGFVDRSTDFATRSFYESN